jgi:hypothetical protein
MDTQAWHPKHSRTESTLGTYIVPSLAWVCHGGLWKKSQPLGTLWAKAGVGRLPRPPSGAYLNWLTISS